MAKAKNDVLGVGLALVGALIYLYAVYELSKLPGFGTGTWFTPIFVGVAAAATLSLLLVSLLGLFGDIDKMASSWALKANFLGGISLFALTAGGPWFWPVAAGFVVAHFGTGKMNM